MTYQERVQALAEEMAHTVYGSTLYIAKIAGDKQYQTRKTQAIEQMLPTARIAVKHMAEAVIIYAYDGDMKAFKRNEANGGYVTNYLKEQGLIPDDGQEAVTNEH